MLTTYTPGFSLKSTKTITKNDIIKICRYLDNQPEYKGNCTFRPEPITEGGIVFKFKNHPEWYKSIRLCVTYAEDGRWDIISKNVMKEWKDNDDMVLPSQRKITLYLKSFNCAPVFTIEELHIFERAFQRIGLVKVGPYPSKRNLITIVKNRAAPSAECICLVIDEYNRAKALREAAEDDLESFAT